jgi:TalC/MipB family fructose-6-phosphate aldolase
MELMFDCADLEQIAKYQEVFPITGVTSNPSILKAEGSIDFYPRMRAIRELIGQEKSLHVQVITQTAEEMIAEGKRVRAELGDDTYIKVPTTEAGLVAMRALKADGARITATAIYARFQGFAAILAGADYIAPYVNRMENLDTDGTATISWLADMIQRQGTPTRIVAASFKNIGQVNAALAAGAQAVTVQPALLHDAFGFHELQGALDAFAADWQGQFGTTELP